MDLVQNQTVKVTVNVQFDLDRDVWEQTRTECGRDYLNRWSLVRARQIREHVENEDTIRDHNQALEEFYRELNRVPGTNLDLRDITRPVRRWFGRNWDEVVGAIDDCATFAGLFVLFGPGITAQLSLPVIGTVTLAAFGCLTGIAYDRLDPDPNFP